MCSRFGSARALQVEFMIIIYQNRNIPVKEYLDKFVHIRFDSEVYYSLIGFGGLIGSLLVVPLEKRFRKGVLVAALLMIGTVGFFAPLVSSFWLAPGLAFSIVSVCNVGWNTLVQSMRQRTVPPEMLGRVLGFSRVVTRLAMPIGAAVGGLMSANVNPVLVFAIAGSAKLVEVIIALVSPIRRM